MYQTLRSVLITCALLLTAVLGAQDLTVNLAAIAEINVTLDNNCQDLLIAEEVLTGDFDDDGDGVSASLDLFTVIVEDGTPGNGPIIDGCGSYTFRVEADASVTGFSTVWGTVHAEDKISPVFVSLPAAPAGPLFCNDIDAISLAMLPSNVSRCYTVNGQTGNTINNSMDFRLRARLVAGGGFPLTFDGCSAEVEICVNDVITRDPVAPQCNDVILTRTFTATDGSCVSAAGELNAPTVDSYDIIFVRPSLDDLDTDNVPDVVTIECTDPEAQGLSVGQIPAPRPQDLPFFTGPGGTQIPLELGDGGFCNIALTFEDGNPIITCDETWKVVRTFTVIDWCVPGDVRTFSQLIKVGDFTAPDFTPPTQDENFDGIPDVGPLTFSTNAGDQCGAFLRLDDPSIILTDACSQTISLSAVIFPNGNLNATPFGTYFIDLNDNQPTITAVIPAGDHVIRYTYSDNCGNEDFTDVDITIVDRTGPVAVCEDGLNISITAGQNPLDPGSTGIAVLRPFMIDNGSYDDCNGVTLSIARVNGNDVNTEPYGQEIFLTCDDVGIVRIGLRVTDDLGNTNDCWLDVLVEDKLRPTCVAPFAETITCFEFSQMFPGDLSDATDDELDAAFGAAAGVDNCEANVTQTVVGGLTNCGVGNFTRRFTVTDGEGFTNANPCVQSIVVRLVHDYVIAFPGDQELDCGEVDMTEELDVTSSGCDLIAINTTVDSFQTDADECYKLRIAYEVINWCEYNGEGQAYIIPRDFDGDNNNAEITYLIVEPFNENTLNDDVAYIDDDPTYNNGPPVRVLDDGNDDDGSDDNNGADNNDFEPYATDDSRGSFVYYQFVRVYDDVAPTITIVDEPEECFGTSGALCAGTVTFDFTAADDCTDAAGFSVRAELDIDYVPAQGFTRSRFLGADELLITADGEYRIVAVNVPTGEHGIRIRVGDGCGNSTIDIIEVCVNDDVAPTPICIPQLTVTLMPDGDGGGTAAIWASDFIASDVDDCSGEVTYSIFSVDQYSVPGFEANPDQPGLLFDCNSSQTTQVRVYAFDPSGAGDYCSAFTLVQGAENVCSSTRNGSIAGTIASESGVVVEGVTMTLTTPEEDIITQTNDLGQYSFSNLPEGADYTADAQLGTYRSHAQGVSTFDLVLITRHILGLIDITSPFQLLAADANGDEEVSVQDIIAIRRLILGLDSAYRSNRPYRFVPAAFIFPVSGNPWATTFPEVVNINNLFGNVRDAHFVAIMVGDVSGNGFDNLTGSTGATGRSNNTTHFTVADQTLLAGQTYEVGVDAGAVATLAGAQGTLSVGSGATLLSVSAATLGTGNYNESAIERGVLPFSFNDSRIGADDRLLTLTLRADRDGRLSEVLGLTDGVLSSEGYAGNTTVNLAIDFRGESGTGTALLQNFPNPVREQTVISYTLEQAGPVVLRLTDVTGRTVLRRTLDGRTGTNVVRLDRTDLGRPGLLTYTIEAGDFTASRKMIVQ